MIDTTIISSSQHCTYEKQDGVNDYSFSHTAGYCGKPQPRRCPCAFCYPDPAFVFDEMAERLRSLADDQNDAADHDELHAAAEVVENTDLYDTNDYVTRWIDALLDR